MRNEEGQHLEFKQSLLDRREIGHYAVGIGNEGGGWLFMGITDDKPRRIVGIHPLTESDLQQIQRSVWDATHIRIEAQLLGMSESPVLAVKIPSRLRGQLFSTQDGKFLMRVGEDLRGMSQVEIAAVLKEAEPPAASSRFVTELKSLPKNQQLYVKPEMPREFERRPLMLDEVNERTITVRTNGLYIHIPASEIADLQWRGKELTLRLKGRLQWLTGTERWECLDDALSESQRQLGIPKAALLEKDRRVQAIIDKLSPKGYRFYWSTSEHLPNYAGKGWQLVYDDDGCYFVAGQNVLVCKPPGT